MTVVGPGNTPTGSRPNFVPEGAQNPNARGSGVTGAIDKELQKAGFKVGLTSQGGLGAVKDFIDTLTPQELVSIGLLLKKQGIPVRASASGIKYLLINDPSLSYLIGQGKVNGFGGLYSLIAEDYAPGLKSSTEKKYTDTRTINDISDEQIGKIIDSASMTTIGRVLPKKQRDAEIAKNRKLADQGTFTTSKKIKDPKTGKDVVVTKSNTPFTAEKATLSLNESLKTSNPKQYQLNQSLGFNDEVKKILAGGI